LLEGAALEELGGGAAGLLQAVKKHAVMSAARRRFFISVNCKSSGNPEKFAEGLFLRRLPSGMTARNLGAQELLFQRAQS